MNNIKILIQHINMLQKIKKSSARYYISEDITYPPDAVMHTLRYVKATPDSETPVLNGAVTVPINDYLDNKDKIINYLYTEFYINILQTINKEEIVLANMN